MADMQGLWRLQNHHHASKIKIAKKVPKTTLQPYYSCSMQKRAAENSD